MNSPRADIHWYSVRLGPALGVALIYLLLFGLPARRESSQQFGLCEKVATQLNRVNVEQLGERLAVTRAEVHRLNNQLTEHQNSHSAFVASSSALNTASGKMRPASVTATLIEHFVRHDISCNSVIPQNSHFEMDDVSAADRDQQMSNQPNTALILKMHLQGGFASMRSALIEMDHNLLPITIEAIEMSEVEDSSVSERGRVWIITLRLPEGQP